MGSRRGRPVGEQPRAVGGDEAPGVLGVLDREGHAGEGADVLPGGDPLVDALGLGQSPVTVDGDEGVERTVHRVDARQGRLGQFPGGHVPAGHAGDELFDGGAAEIHPEDATPRRSKAPRRRAYSTMSLPDPPPRQTLANMAAALVEQSQNYLRRPTGLEHPRQLVARRRRHRNPFSPADSTATYSGSAGSLTDMGLERLRHAQAQTAFLGISPGRNLLLMPTHGSPRLLPAESPRDDAAPHEPSL